MNAEQMVQYFRERAEKAEAALVLIGEKAMVDFDDATVGQVDSVVKNREKYVDWLRKLELSVVRHAEAVALLREARAGQPAWHQFARRIDDFLAACDKDKQ